ncbi:hypothetical protein ACHZ98_28535 [Streptomyces sp. MAR4 CNY-716]
MVSPRRSEDVNPDILKAAVLEGSNVRNGTEFTDFAQLLAP